ncbi:MAG TPA: 30S ribosomal protein S12 methylthiotransferase RimO [Candidatus Gemmiger faecavium]|nr:30S ribosomal protein S12 methylthiotransferase RimO [Candidatus Gemmiger faecavium]
MKIAIVSLGCPKNQVDADVFCHALLADGHETVADPAEADAIIVNTCGFIQSAKEEAIENILLACGYKQQNPELKVIVTGCLAERYKGEIAREMPEVDAVVGIGSNKALPEILRRVCADGADQIESYGPKADMPLGGRRVISTPRHYAYLKIAEGCNNRCHYCAIPLIRGPLRSRPLEDCVAEAEWLAGEGVRELIVVAQDPTAYGEDWGKPGAVCKLLDRLNAIQGLRWIRVLYAYPERITDEFIAAMQRNEKVVPYLDLPIQHCNDEILRGMNRRGGRKEIEDAIARLRAAIPNLTLRTTLIAGFPGETEEQYAELCDFVRTVEFDRLGCFAYSPEENTVAARMENQLDEETKQRRADHIMEIQAEISARKQAERVGQTLECVCDGIDEESGMYLLRSKGDCPEIDGCVLTPGDVPLETGVFYNVTVTDSDTYDLYGYVENKVEE